MVVTVADLANNPAHHTAMKAIHLVLTVIISTMFMPSCATKFTAAQRAELATVAVAKSEVEEDAYAEPYGGSQEAIDAGNQAGAGAGAIGAMVGSLTGQAIAGTQNQVFRNKSEGYFAAVQRNTPPDMGGLMSAKMKFAAKEDRFFGTRLRETSGCLFTSKIISYGLVRSGKDENGNLILTPQVVAEISLKDAAGKNLSRGTFTGNSGLAYPVADYAGNPTKSKAGYAIATATCAQAFFATLDSKTKD